jgi:hypothetical protein
MPSCGPALLGSPPQCEAGYDRCMMSGAPAAVRASLTSKRDRLVPSSSGRREAPWGRGVGGWIAGSAASLAIVLGAGCSSEERLPPPHGPIRGGATTGAGGVGGGEIEAGTGAGAPPSNVCECMAAYGGRDSPCADCINAQTAAEARCEPQRAACDEDPACQRISLCLRDCGQDTACQKACVFPENAGAAHDAYQKVLACACAECGGTCASRDPLDCPPLSGRGGGAAGGGG